MTFLNPLFLFAIAGIALPIIIHLFSKPQLRRVKWAAMNLLLTSVQKNRSKARVEDLLLLILRCLVIATLAILFARPAFLVDNTGPELNNEVEAVVIILDNSASMGQSDGFKTRFERAKENAGETLGKLAPGSSCALFLETDRVKSVIPRPTSNLTVVQRSIDQAGLTDGGSDLLPGLQAAVRVLKTSPEKKKEIFLFTDSQLAAWRELDAIRKLQNDNSKEVKFSVVVIGDKGEDNLGVSALSVDDRTPTINEPIPCTVTIANWSQKVATQIPVKLAVDQGPPLDEGMIDSVDPGSSKSVELSVRFKDPGFHSVTATIPGDLLPFDNQRTVAVTVTDKVHTLIVQGDSGTPGGDGFFIKNALIPVSPDKKAAYYLTVQTEYTNYLEASPLESFQVVFLANVSRLSPGSVNNIKDYLNNGGGVVVFPGSTTDVGYFNTDPSFAALLPASLDNPQAPPGDVLGWQSDHYGHPLTQLWNDPDAGNLGSVHVTKYFPLHEKAAVGTAIPKVVVNYTTGTPAVVEWSVGRGKVLFFSAPASPQWTTLPVHPSFVPLITRIVSFMGRRSETNMNIAPGDTFTTQVDPDSVGSEVFVMGPGDLQKKAAGTVELGDKTGLLNFSDTDKAGAYQLFIGNDTKPAAVFAVQTDPSESNLAQNPKTEIGPLLNPPLLPATGNPPEETQKRDKVPGPELWLPFALAAIFLSLAELGLAHLSSQPK